MKFLILTNHSYMLWRFRKELIEALLERGEVVLSMPFVGHEKDFGDLGCRCIETPLNRRNITPLKDVQLLAFYRKLLRAERPDMVITYSIKPNIYGSYLCGKLNIPCCVNVQGLGTAFENPSVAKVVTVMYRKAIKRSKVVFFENQSNADAFVSRRILPAGKPTVLPGAGVNTEYYAFSPLPSSDNGICFLYLGRIMREKGIEEFFTAARSMKRKFGDRVRFELVGFFEDDYEQQARDLADQGILQIYGFQVDPRPYYQGAHCVVLPSYHEGMSNVLLEAAASGRPVIASNIPGCREAVIDGTTGYLCEKKNAESLEKCMERFLLLIEEERREMGLQGRKLITAKFGKQSVVDATLSEILK